MTRLHREMTKQEVFDALVKISEEGGFPCHDEERRCRYRHDGRGCAIGVFLPDDVAIKLDSRKGVSVYRDDVYQECQPYLPEWMTKRIATSIQQAHDSILHLNGAAFAERFKTNLQRILELKGV